MKKIRKTARCGFAFLLSLVLVMGITVTAGAAETADLDMDETGSITLTLADSDGTVVSGGAISLYKVAALYLDDGNMAYALTDAFLGCTTVLDVEDSSLASELAAYAEENNISGTTASVGEDGIISFDGLALGLYLVVQTTESDHYETINPFVVTVPMEEEGVWVYAVDASPKVGTVTVTEPETATTTTTTATTTTTTTTTATTLPQTGQLYWPIPVLAIAGFLLLAAGWYLNRSDKKRGSYAA